MSDSGLVLEFIFLAAFRFGLPILVTAVLIYLLRRLDTRWQKEATVRLAAEGSSAKNVGCWDVNKCSAEMRAKCTAYAHPETPCWQHFREESGKLQDKCLLCNVFKKAPIPIPA